MPTTAAAALASTRSVTGFGPPRRSPTENNIAMSVSPTYAAHVARGNGREERFGQPDRQRPHRSRGDRGALVATDADRPPQAVRHGAAPSSRAAPSPIAPSRGRDDPRAARTEARLRAATSSAVTPASRWEPHPNQRRRRFAGQPAIVDPLTQVGDLARLGVERRERSRCCLPPSVTASTERARQRA